METNKITYSEEKIENICKSFIGKQKIEIYYIFNDNPDYFNIPKLAFTYNELFSDLPNSTIRSLNKLKQNTLLKIIKHIFVLLFSSWVICCISYSYYIYGYTIFDWSDFIVIRSLQYILNGIWCLSACFLPVLPLYYLLYMAMDIFDNILIQNQNEN